MIDRSKNLSAFGNSISPFFAGHIDEFFKPLEDLMTQGRSTYPPRNVKRLDDGSYVVEFALAGWAPEDVEVTQERRYLLVASKKNDTVEEISEDEIYAYKGISHREFNVRMQLAQNMEVVDAKMENGLLSVYVERIVPEEDKPRLVQINSQ